MCYVWGIQRLQKNRPETKPDKCLHSMLEGENMRQRRTNINIDLETYELINNLKGYISHNNFLKQVFTSRIFHPSDEFFKKFCEHYFNKDNLRFKVIKFLADNPCSPLKKITINVSDYPNNSAKLQNNVFKSKHRKGNPGLIDYGFVAKVNTTGLKRYYLTSVGYEALKILGDEVGRK